MSAWGRKQTLGLVATLHSAFHAKLAVNTAKRIKKQGNHLIRDPAMSARVGSKHLSSIMVSWAALRAVYGLAGHFMLYFNHKVSETDNLCFREHRSRMGRAGYGGPTRIRTWNQRIMSPLL